MVLQAMPILQEKETGLVDFCGVDCLPRGRLSIGVGDIKGVIEERGRIDLAATKRKRQ
jgi:hypothetical protein